MEHVPLASIILVVWNSDEYISKCLHALSKQICQDFEIIIVDNGTFYEFKNELRKWPGLDVKLLQLTENLGFAAANNLGANLAGGEWLALLNIDAFPEPEWLQNLLQAAKDQPDYSFFSSRQIQAGAPHLLDGAGDAYHMSGLAWRNLYNFPADHHGLLHKEVFSACAAAALISRQEFLALGGFDGDYFSYFEDVDLGFRLRLAGRKCLYVPDAIVLHVGSASTGKRSDFSVYYGYRNLIWTFLKNMPVPLIGFLLPLHIGTLLFFLVYLTIRGQGLIMLRAIFHALLGLKAVFNKRRGIQRNMKIPWQDLLKVMSNNLLEPYQEFIKRNMRS